MTSYFRKYATSAYIPDFTKAQQSGETGYVSPIAEPPREDTPTRALPHPENSRAVVPKPKLTVKQPDQEVQPEIDREYAIPMYPGVAQELNDSIKDNSELFSYWRSGPAPTWNPWHPGYTRKPNTVAPDNKNPELHDEEAYVRIFGPRPADWRQDNPAGWFNFATASKNGEVFDEDKVWREYMENHDPHSEIAPAEVFPGSVEEEESQPEFTRQQMWAQLEKEDPIMYRNMREHEVAYARDMRNKTDPNINGPFIDIQDSNHGNLLLPYGSVIKFPDIVDIANKYSSPGESETKYWEMFPYRARSTSSAGVHEGTHGITHFLSGVNMDHGKYPLNQQGIVPTHTEIPTTSIENIWGNDGKFVPLMNLSGKPYRDVNDEYLNFIYPTADNPRVAMAGQVDPTHMKGSESGYIPESKIPTAQELEGIRFWNIADPSGKPAKYEQLRFFPDTPTGLYYDKFGNLRLSGGELADYQHIWGDGKTRDVSELPFNLQRNMENMGQAPQAWIDAIDDPEGFAAAQDRVRRELFPLKRKDVLGDLRSGDMGSVSSDLDRHPALELIRSRIPDNLDSMSDEERLDLYNKIADEVEMYYPELRLNPEATPDYLVQAQKIFGLDPDMGVTTVRTKRQYDDAAKYIDYYRRLDEYLRQNYYQ